MYGELDPSIPRAITNAVRQKLVAEQDALRQKAVEADALRKRTQVETEAEAARLRAQAETDDEKHHAELELLKKRNTRTVEEEQVAVEKAEAQAHLVKARADSEQMKILAEGQAAQNRGKALELSPLLIQQKAYGALGALGGMDTTIYLGDPGDFGFWQPSAHRSQATTVKHVTLDVPFPLGRYSPTHVDLRSSSFRSPRRYLRRARNAVAESPR